MPIKPENKKLYPKDWKQISHRIRFERAKGKCEWCGVRHGAYGFRDDFGIFVEANRRMINLYGRKPMTIILTVAHLDHDPTNSEDDSNLAALCQKCHLSYDVEHHAETAKETRRAKKLAKEDEQGQVRLFEGKNNDS